MLDTAGFSLFHSGFTGHKNGRPKTKLTLATLFSQVELKVGANKKTCIRETEKFPRQYFLQGS
jgi:hypothetical protein